MPTRPGRPLRFVGVDLASQPKKSSLCVIEWDDRPRVVDLIRPVFDDTIVEQAAAADATGLDCPLGWPAKFVETVRRHHEGEAIADVEASPRELRLRTTDRWIREHDIPRDPLSVSTDRLGIVALRGIGILERIAGPGADRSGAAGIYETYPSGSLAKWGLRSTGYKDRAATAARREIVESLAPHVDLAGRAEELVANDDDLDAVITAVVTGLAHMGLTTSAPAEHHDAARVEGWIHVPEIPVDGMPDRRQNVTNHPGSEVAAAYDHWADIYATLFEAELDTRPDEQRLIEDFTRAAAAVEPRRIADIGCGPGHVMAHVVRLGRQFGATTIGVDASRAMVTIARRQELPGPLLVGGSAALPFGDGTCSGVLSRHALIHTPPDLIPRSIAEFARVLAPGGSILLTFSAAGDRGHGEAFDHKVATAYRWDPEVIGSILASVGFDDIVRHDLPRFPADRFAHVSLAVPRRSPEQTLTVGSE